MKANIRYCHILNFGHDYYYKVTVYQGNYPYKSRLCHTLSEARDYARANAKEVYYG